jgi:hypothetical protein
MTPKRPWSNDYQFGGWKGLLLTHSRHKLANLAAPCQAAPESGIRQIAVGLYGARHVRCVPKA